MRVLIAHNRYRSAAPSGENSVVDAEMALLAAAGVEVVRCIEESDSLIGASVGAKLGAAVGPIYAPSGVRRFRDALEATRPDVVHMHNVFPLLSPYIVRAAKAAGVPVVQTVHNYRHTCVNGLHVREGHRCDDCLGRRIPWPAVKHACYRGSNLQSLPMALSQMLHEPTWQLVDAYLALTPFMRDRLVAAGLPRDRIVLRPTWVPDTGNAEIATRDFAFVGRLDEPKGVGLLLAAWCRSHPPGRQLVIAGDGPLRHEVEVTAQHDPSIRYAGSLEPRDVSDLMGSVSAVVIPSIVYEGLPLTLVEAFARGRPVVVLEGGSPASLVAAGPGWVAAPDASGLAHVLVSITDADVAVRGRLARQTYESDFTPEAALRSLLQVYESVAA